MGGWAGRWGSFRTWVDAVVPVGGGPGIFFATAFFFLCYTGLPWHFEYEPSCTDVVVDLYCILRLIDPQVVLPS